LIFDPEMEESIATKRRVLYRLHRSIFQRMATLFLAEFTFSCYV
jgi:hypothetical protein